MFLHLFYKSVWRPLVTLFCVFKNSDAGDIVEVCGDRNWLCSLCIKFG